jgi:hypothetical protein
MKSLLVNAVAFSYRLRTHGRIAVISQQLMKIGPGRGGNKEYHEQESGNSFLYGL